MTRTEIESSLQELNGLVLQGRMMDAFEKFYHEDVSMQENELAPTVSKKLNRQRELEFYDAVTEFRGAQVEGLGWADHQGEVCLRGVGCGLPVADAGYSFRDTSHRAR